MLPEEDPGSDELLVSRSRRLAHDVHVRRIEAKRRCGRTVCHQVHPQQLRPSPSPVQIQDPYSYFRPLFSLSLLVLLSKFTHLPFFSFPLLAFSFPFPSVSFPSMPWFYLRPALSPPSCSPPSLSPTCFPLVLPLHSSLSMSSLLRWTPHLWRDGRT